MTQIVLTLAQLYIVFILGYAIRTFLKIRKLEREIKELTGED